MDLQTDSALRQKYPANVEGSPEFNRACEADRLFDQFCKESGMDEDDVRAAAWHKSGMIYYTKWLLAVFSRANDDCKKARKELEQKNLDLICEIEELRKKNEWLINRR